MNASGLVSEVLFAEGDKVKAGDVIARLDAEQSQTLESAQAKAAQELTTAYQDVRDSQFKLDNFDVPSDFDGMTPSEAVSAMLTALDKARADFEPYKDLEQRLEYEMRRDTRENPKVYRDTAKIYKQRLDDAWADYRKAVQWLDLDSTLANANARLVLAQRDYDALKDRILLARYSGNPRCIGERRSPRAIPRRNYEPRPESRRICVLGQPRRYHCGRFPVGGQNH